MLRWLHDELARPSLSASSAWEWPPSKAMPRCRRGPPRAGSSVRRSGRSRPGGGLRVRPSSSRGCAGDPHSARPTGAASAQRGDRARLRAADLSVASAAVIDLHCHLLPALDDGPAEEQASIALARGLVEDGVRIAAATPHLRSDHPDVAPAELAGRCRALEDRCADEGVPLRIVPGGEVDLLWAQSASAEDLALASYGQRGSDLLVETPYGPLPRSFERLVSELQEAGFRILLAHPERSPTFQQDPQRLADSSLEQSWCKSRRLRWLETRGGRGRPALPARSWRTARPRHRIGLPRRRPFRPSFSGGRRGGRWPARSRAQPMDGHRGA